MNKSDRQLETVIYGDTIEREPLETFDAPLWWQDRGLSCTITGYGDKIPTRYKVKHNNRLKRVYCRIFSNSGNLYIMNKGDKVVIDEY